MVNSTASAVENCPVWRKSLVYADGANVCVFVVLYIVL